MSIGKIIGCLLLAQSALPLPARSMKVKRFMTRYLEANHWKNFEKLFVREILSESFSPSLSQSDKIG